jgi:Domain of unknown function (DUF6379)
MYEKYMIMTRGFKNLRQNDEVIGFQFNLRTTYYRGVYLAIIAGLDLSVDGKEIQPDQIRVAFGGRDYTLQEMTREEKARWPFGDPATVTVLKKGGLQPGLHEFVVTQVIKPAYIPGRGFVATAAKRMTLVQ